MQLLHIDIPSIAVSQLPNKISVPHKPRRLDRGGSFVRARAGAARGRLRLRAALAAIDHLRP